VRRHGGADLAALSRRLLRIAGCGLAAVFLLVLDADMAAAACADSPAPGVNWQRCLLDNVNLSRHDLHGANLREAFFSRADLSGANLEAIDGRRARFTTANLANANLENARLLEADFTKAVLTGANLRGADLRGSLFFRADLRKADLTGAQIGRTGFQKADLSGARWIDGKTVCAEGSIGQCS
jgi:uncharacterized protein YjbI with pentapeptide repeats